MTVLTIEFATQLSFQINQPNTCAVMFKPCKYLTVISAIME